MTTAVANVRTTTETVTQKAEPSLIKQKLENVNPQAAAEIRRFLDVEEKLVTYTLQRMWHLGRCAENLRSNPGMNKAKHGDEPINPIKILAELVDKSESFINKMAQLFRAFPKDSDRDRLLNYRMVSGAPLTWAHMEALIPLYSDEGSRSVFDNLIQRTLAESLTPKEIMQVIASTKNPDGRPTTRGGGRPTNVPPTLGGKATRLITQTDVLVKNIPEIYEHETHNFMASLKEMGQEVVAEKATEIKHNFIRIRENLAALQAFCARTLDDVIPEAEQYIAACINAKAASDGKHQAEALEATDKGDTKS